MKTGVMYGIDVSHWQGTIDWKKVANVAKFAIIKAGGSDKGFYMDKMFNYNYVCAKEAGLHVGAYYFVGKKCISEKDGAADAVRFINIIRNKQFDMPVYLDFESPSAKTRKGNTDAAVAFCRTLEQAGYFTGIYASDIGGFRDKLDLSRLKDFTLWVARYGNEPMYVKNYGIWQSTEKGKIKGINTYVDLDVCYSDFPSIIINGGFNNYRKGEK